MTYYCQNQNVKINLKIASVMLNTVNLMKIYIKIRRNRMSRYDEAIKIINDRFGCDSLISVATSDGSRLHVRTVDGYYEEGMFYVITYALSNKMKQNRSLS